ncbi:hypothetical protein SAMN06265219_110135 [Gracilimonas mengyeensis]|uniref:Uncharacterized protein n=2 Tax=Gracilimonas mengyeensis TaxID=1302730 RepID=A0A521E3Z8_9BACT|nr:hypothetical protein SAMN06265219_110135 [Gracilimonas mengyeensis]
MFILTVAFFSFQTTSSEVNAESAIQQQSSCTIKMGSFKFLGCWGNTDQFCKSKGDCDDDLRAIKNEIRIRFNLWHCIADIFLE